MEERAARSSRLSGDLVRGQVPEGGRGGQSQQEAKTGLEELLAGLEVAVLIGEVQRVSERAPAGLAL